MKFKIRVHINWVCRSKGDVHGQRVFQELGAEEGVWTKWVTGTGRRGKQHIEQIHDFYSSP
jgi:hypothetical protein